MSIRRAAGVLEIIDPFPFHVGVFDPAEIDPRVCVLMAEKRHEVEIFPSVTICPPIGAAPGVPYGRRDGMSRRAERKDRDNHRLIVTAPKRVVKPFLGFPAHDYSLRVSHSPLPVYPPINGISESTNIYLGTVALVKI